jgi:hypothetical protein
MMSFPLSEPQRETLGKTFFLFFPLFIYVMCVLDYYYMCIQVVSPPCSILFPWWMLISHVCFVFFNTHPILSTLGV